jgi:sugar lactone lactonase YvrE
MVWMPLAVFLMGPLLVGCGDDETGAGGAGGRGGAGGTGGQGGDAGPSAALLVGNTRGDSVVLYDEDSGTYLGELIPPGGGGLKAPDFMLLHTDGHLYVSSGDDAASSAVLRYRAEDGEFIDIFAQGGGLVRPYGLAFGADGMLYVSSFLTDQILRFDGGTGAFVDVFAEGDGMPGGLNGPNGLAFGPDGMLYVTTEGSVAVDGEATFPGLPSQVLRFDVGSGAATLFIDQPQPSADSAGFVSLLGLAFGPDCEAGTCDLFVSDFANDIRRHDRASGALLATLPTGYEGTTPRGNFMGGLAFGRDGALFTVGFDSADDSGAPGTILRFDSASGQPLPAEGEQGAIFVPEDPRMKRPIGLTVRRGP